MYSSLPITLYYQVNAYFKGCCNKKFVRHYCKYDPKQKLFITPTKFHRSFQEVLNQENSCLEALVYSSRFSETQKITVWTHRPGVTGVLHNTSM